MSDISFQDIFKFKTVLKNIEIRLSARAEHGLKKLLALVTSDGDIVLYYKNGNFQPTVRRLTWFTDSKKNVEAICIDPTATWLLAVALDSTVFIIPALALVDKAQKIDCKWAINDLTQFPKHQQIPTAKPTFVIWWQTIDCNQNALVSYDSGEIALISLTDGRCVGNTAITESVLQMVMCQDNSMDIVCLLITGISGRQWRLVLEQHSTGYVFPPDSNNDESARSRLFNLKQMGADKLASLKQKIAEARGQRRDSQTSDSASDTSNSESTQSSHPEMLPHLRDMHFAPQFAHNRYLFSAFYKPSGTLTIHSVDPDSSPLHVYKLPTGTHSAILTENLLYTINNDMNLLSIISTQYSECHLENEGDFCSLDPIAMFDIQNKDERILSIYKLSNSAVFHEKKGSNDLSLSEHETKAPYSLPKSVDDLNIYRPTIDTCVLVTNQSVYEVVVNTCPITKFIKAVTEESNFELAERICYVFSLNQQQLLELCGDILIANGSFHSGLILYKQAKVHLLKRVLKVAISADCKSLLKFVNLCLSSGRVDMSVATKIHIGNLAVMAYTELVLRYSGFLRVSNLKEFMNFLCFEEYYDQVLAVNVACQAGLWSIVTVLAKSRGLQIEVVAALCQIVQTNRAPTFNNEDFTLAVSEPSLTPSFLVYPLYSQIILNYIRTNVDSFSTNVLKRFLIQLDPSQPSIMPFVSKLFQHHRMYSSLDSTLDSTDFENPDKSVAIVKELIETFICVLITFISKTSDKRFDISLVEKIPPPEAPIEKPRMKKFPDLRQLSCGFEHAAIIRNGSVYTMGVSTSGCLGLGPLLTQTSPPKIVQTLTDLKVKALSVSCGRKHTLVLTDFGVYGWGSNSYGQLALGPIVQESPYPQLITSLSHLRIVDVVAGQYHSMALTADGQVYTWGWGIHGQLGHGTCDNEYYPKLLQFADTVMQIAAGHAHSLILTCDGKLYGFGFNAFGQLSTDNTFGSKTTQPMRVFLQPDIHIPIEKVTTSYFHNIAVRADQQVYSWGASPQDVRMSRSRKCADDMKPFESCKSTILLYSSANTKSIEQIAVGYRHSVILDNGRIHFTKYRGGQLSSPKMNEHDRVFNQKFVEISSGSDFMMALEQNGRVLAWGGPSLSQTILGRTVDEESARRLDGKIVVFKNTKRIIKFPSTAQSNSEPLPIEIPGLPSLAISFNSTDPRNYISRHFNAVSIVSVENEAAYKSLNCNKPLSKNSQILDDLFEAPNLKFTETTLHYVLETYYNYYDTEIVLAKCLDVGDFQAASKVAILDGHFSDSLGFQLAAFRRYMDGFILDFGDIKRLNKSTDDLNEINEKLHSKNCSPARILSSSSSLDSIQQWGDEMEHQGGCESPCRLSDMGDVRQNVTQYVQSVKNDNSPPISSLSKIVDSKDVQNRYLEKETQPDMLDDKTKEVVKIAADLVEFYTRKIYASENHILMQNVLMKCIDFWLVKNLPVTMLEEVLLKNMDKYFYPLSILLFCKNFNNNTGEELPDAKIHTSATFLKQFSTKFCLQLCSMVLENVNKM